MKNITKDKITSHMIGAAETVFMAMAYMETIRPIVEKYQQEFLEVFEPIVYEKLRSRRGDNLITDIKDTWLMNPDDYELYIDWCNEKRDIAGLTVDQMVDNEAYCPLLVAEELQRIAERNLINSMYPITKLTADDVICGVDGLKNYKKLIDLSLRLLSGFCDSKKILKK